MKKLGIALLLLMCVDAQANYVKGAEMTVADLELFCTTSDEGGKNACRFYIYGVVQGEGIAAGVMGDKAHFCYPDELSSAAMEVVVKMRMGEDLMIFPQDRSMPAVSFVTAVMMKEFPCHKTN